MNDTSNENIIKYLLKEMKEYVKSDSSTHPVDKKLNNIAQSDEGDLGDIARAVIYNINYLHTHFHQTQQTVIDKIIEKINAKFIERIVALEKNVDGLKKLFEIVCSEKLKEYK